MQDLTSPTIPGISEKKLGPPLGWSQFHYLFSFQYYTAYCRASTKVDRSPPDIPHLIEECHDIVDYRHEKALSFLTVGALLDKITALLGMLVGGYKLTRFILVDQVSSVA